MSSSRQFGTIKLWNEDPGNGRIIPQDGGPDLTVVLADIESEQHPLAGSAVTFTKDGQDRAVEVEVVAEVNKKEPRYGNWI
jgi:cold shock CspA family protein